MTQQLTGPTSPPGISPLAFWGFAVVTFFGGWLTATAFHEVANLRPYVPPIMAQADTLACGDIDAYVRHVQDLHDHHTTKDLFGIHRAKTVAAVNELYDRARCEKDQNTASGRETYKHLPADWVDITAEASPSPPIAAESAPAVRTVFHFGSGSTAAADTAAPAAKRPAVQAVTTRRRAVVLGDGTLDASPPPAPPSAGCVPRTTALNFGYNYCK